MARAACDGISTDGSGGKCVVDYRYGGGVEVLNAVNIAGLRVWQRMDKVGVV